MTTTTTTKDSKDNKDPEPETLPLEVQLIFDLETENWFFRVSSIAGEFARSWVQCDPGQSCRTIECINGVKGIFTITVLDAEYLGDMYIHYPKPHGS